MTVHAGTDSTDTGSDNTGTITDGFDGTGTGTDVMGTYIDDSGTGIDHTDTRTENIDTGTGSTGRRTDTATDITANTVLAHAQHRYLGPNILEVCFIRVSSGKVLHCRWLVLSLLSTAGTDGTW